MLSKQARANGISGTVSAQRATALAAVGTGNLLSAGRLNRKASVCWVRLTLASTIRMPAPHCQYSEFDGGIARLKLAQNFTSSQVAPSTGRPCRMPADG